MVETFRKWLDRYQPEALLGHTDDIMRVADALGLDVPGDLAVAGLNCRELDRETVGVRQNHEAVGRLDLDIVAGFMSQHKYGLPLTRPGHTSMAIGSMVPLVQRRM